MRKGTNVDTNFYYNAGLAFGRKYGDKSITFRRRYVDEFKAYVDGVGGPDAFPTVEAAVESFFKNVRRKTNVKKY